jgi:NAD(P)-dependent dehydrogenase (short-subunit alcohol dehydrogenase family)
LNCHFCHVRRASIRANFDPEYFTQKIYFMELNGKTILITGANRGIGRGLVEEALKRGAKRVFAGTRVPLTHPDPRVIPLLLDVTIAEQIENAVATIGDLDILVNNAGVALAPLPLIASYSISKAAAFSLTQSLRAFLAAKGIRVHAVLTGPVDTDMNRGLDIPKASPESAAFAIFEGVEEEEEDIFPDPMSAAMADGWRRGAVKAMERQNAQFVATDLVRV